MKLSYTYSTPMAVVYFIPVTTGSEGSWRSNSIFSVTNASYPIPDLASLDKSKSIDTSILQITVRRQVNGIGVNSFQIILVDKMDSDGLTWMDKIYPHDLVLIGMCRPGVDTEEGEGKVIPVMLGVVENITKSTTLGGNPESPTVERQVEVSGYEIPGIASSHVLFSSTNIIPALSQIKEKLGVHSVFLEGMKTIFITEDLVAPVEKVVATYFNKVLLQDLKHVHVPALSTTLDNLIHFDEGSRSFQELQIYGMRYTEFSGSGVQFLDQVIQKPFNELLTRYDFLLPTDPKGGLPDVKCRVLLRPSPFVYVWNDPNTITSDTVPLQKEVGQVDLNGMDVKVHDISDLDVIAESIGRGTQFDHNVFLVDAATPEAIGIQLILNLDAVCDLEHIKRHGLNPLIMKFDYFSTKETITELSKANPEESAVVKLPESMKTLATNLANTLKQWYVKSCEYLKGTIRIRGMAKIREGDAIRYTTEDYRGKTSTFLFYVDTVSHVFVNFETFITVLEVSRGVEVS